MNARLDITKIIIAGAANAGAFAIWFFNYDRFDQYLYPHLWHMLWSIPAISLYWVLIKDSPPIVRLSALSFLDNAADSMMGLARQVLFLFRMLALAFLIMAASRPQAMDSEENASSKGIDIVMVLDLSSSMLARDLRPSRIEASKKVGIDFIAGREHDRFGLVCYAGNARTMSPLTTDHHYVQKLTEEAEVGLLDDGTAIGLGLGYAVNRLRESDAVSKVIILLTDGENNVRSYPPLTYAESAREFGVKVYTIGVGKNGDAEAPVDMINGRYIYGLVPVSIDEEMLQSIADITGGQYFRATNNEKLKEIYEQIDQLEKSEIEKKVLVKYEEKFFPFALIASLLLLLEFVFRNTIFRSAT